MILHKPGARRVSRKWSFQEKRLWKEGKGVNIRCVLRQKSGLLRPKGEQLAVSSTLGTSVQRHRYKEFFCNGIMDE